MHSMESGIQVDRLFKGKRSTLRMLSQEIWKNPETCYEEHFAHRILTDTLEAEGFLVTRQLGGISTAFRAEFQSEKFDAGKDRTIGVLCEYDALPGIGHACGHNLIATAGVAAGLAIKMFLGERSDGKTADHCGRVVVLGTPAEEGGAGKVKMLQNKAFLGLDCVMMVHPFSCNDLKPLSLGIKGIDVEFYGKPADAACGPCEGVNALDAAVSAYNSFSLLRQHLRHDHRINCCIASVGREPSIIPDYSKLSFYLRAQKQGDLQDLTDKVLACCESAALITRCTSKITNLCPPVCGVLHNDVMGDTFKKFSEADGEFEKVSQGELSKGRLILGVPYTDRPSEFYGSTDFGPVSAVAPSIHPCYSLGKNIMIHTEEFRELAATEEAFDLTLKAAKGMALTAFLLLDDINLFNKVKQDFLEQRVGFLGKCAYQFEYH